MESQSESYFSTLYHKAAQKLQPVSHSSVFFTLMWESCLNSSGIHPGGDLSTVLNPPNDNDNLTCAIFDPYSILMQMIFPLNEDIHRQIAERLIGRCLELFCMDTVLFRNTPGPVKVRDFFESSNIIHGDLRQLPLRRLRELRIKLTEPVFEEVMAQKMDTFDSCQKEEIQAYLNRKKFDMKKESDIFGIFDESTGDLHS